MPAALTIVDSQPLPDQAAQTAPSSAGGLSIVQSDPLPTPSAAEHVSAFMKGLKTAPILHPWDMLKATGSMAIHPIDTFNQVLQGFDVGQERAQKSWESGEYVPAVIHSGLSMVPFLGPAIDQHYQEMKEAEARGDSLGQVEAAGKMMGIGASVELGRRAPEIIKGAPGAVKAAGSTAADAVTFPGVAEAAGGAGLMLAGHEWGVYPAIRGLSKALTELQRRRVIAKSSRDAAAQAEEAANQAARDAADAFKGNAVETPPETPQEAAPPTVIGPERQLTAPSGPPPIIAGPITPTVIENPPAMPETPAVPAQRRASAPASTATAPAAKPISLEEKLGFATPPRVEPLQTLISGAVDAGMVRQRDFLKMSPQEQAYIRSIYEHVNAEPTDTTTLNDRVVSNSEPVAPVSAPEPAAAPPAAAAPAPEPAPAPAAEPVAAAEPAPAAAEPAAKPANPAPTSTVVNVPGDPNETYAPAKLMSEEGVAKYAANNPGITEDEARKMLEADGHRIVGRPWLNNALHAAGRGLGMDHSTLSNVAAITFKQDGIRSMEQMSQEQMLQLYGNLIEEQATRAALKTKGELTGATIGEGQTSAEVQQGVVGAPTEGVPSPRAVSPGGAPSPDASATKVIIPGVTTRYPARYRVKELSDIQPSHNGLTFQPNPKYRLKNDRDYTELDNQAKILDGARPDLFEPSLHITDNPDATNGPPLVDSQGNVIGGNGRTMMMQRVYAYNPRGAAEYRALLNAKAAQYGIDPAEFADMKQPVLVREIADEHLANIQNAVTDFNKPGTSALRPNERAIADSRRVSQGTLDHIAGKIADVGEDAKLADVLKDKSGVEILDKLIGDGVISPQERAGYATGNVLTKDGQNRISRLMIGRFFRDTAQMDIVEPAIRNKIERVAAPLASVENLGEWNLTPRIQAAIDIMDDARTHGVKNLKKNLDTFIKQKFLTSAGYSPKAIEMVKILDGTPPNQLNTALARYAADAQHYAQGSGLFGDMKTPDQVLAEALEYAKPKPKPVEAVAQQ